MKVTRMRSPTLETCRSRITQIQSSQSKARVPAERLSMAENGLSACASLTREASAQQSSAADRYHYHMDRLSPGDHANDGLPGKNEKMRKGATWRYVAAIFFGTIGVGVSAWALATTWRTHWYVIALFAAAAGALAFGAKHRLSRHHIIGYPEATVAAAHRFELPSLIIGFICIPTFALLRTFDVPVWVTYLPAILIDVSFAIAAGAYWAEASVLQYGEQLVDEYWEADGLIEDIRQLENHLRVHRDSVDLQRVGSNGGGRLVSLILVCMVALTSNAAAELPLVDRGQSAPHAPATMDIYVDITGSVLRGGINEYLSALAEALPEVLDQIPTVRRVRLFIWNGSASSAVGTPNREWDISRSSFPVRDIMKRRKATDEMRSAINSMTGQEAGQSCVQQLVERCRWTESAICVAFTDFRQESCADQATHIPAAAAGNRTLIVLLPAADGDEILTKIEERAKILRTMGVEVYRAPGMDSWSAVLNR